MNPDWLKYSLYEATVQSPRWQVDFLPQFHTWLTKKPARVFREDFCGSAKISCEWVKKSPRNFATALDVDAHPLDYARAIHLPELTPDQRGRIALKQHNVLKPTAEKFDWIGAFNFSFYDFYERQKLLRYARSAFQSLRAPGTLFLEMAGGQGFLEPLTEGKTVSIPGTGKVKQIWEQHGYDPISQFSDYSIHFQMPDRSWMNDAFRYHWRIWNIREVREVLADAGFHESHVLWPRSHSHFEISEDAEDIPSWVAYVIGFKRNAG